MATTDSTTKPCSRCKKQYPITTEYFGKDSYALDGLRSECRACRTNNPNCWEQQKKRQSLRGANKKECCKCKQLFPATPEYFHRRADHNDGLASWCILCKNKTARETYSNSPEARQSHKQKAIEKRKDPEYRDKSNALVRDWYHTEHGKQLSLDSSRRRRARKKGAEGFHTAADVDLQYKSQKGRCWHCGKALNGTFHIDHLIPLAKGGTDNATNIVCSCVHCNLSKGAKLTQDWNGKLF